MGIKVRDILIVFVSLALFAIVVNVWSEFQAVEKETTVCTADVAQCADGSYVGRVPPQCAFAECPSF